MGRLAHVAFWPGTALTTAQMAQIADQAVLGSAADYQSFVENLDPTLYYPLAETSGTTAANLGTAGSGDAGTYSSGITLANQADPTGRAALASDPPAPATATLVAGTAYQNATGADLWLTVPITYSPTSTAAATVVGGVGPTSTPATTTYASEPAGSPVGAIHPLMVYVPQHWYVLLSVANASLGPALSQPV